MARMSPFQFPYTAQNVSDLKFKNIHYKMQRNIHKKFLDMHIKFSKNYSTKSATILSAVVAIVQFI